MPSAIDFAVREACHRSSSPPTCHLQATLVIWTAALAFALEQADTLYAYIRDESQYMFMFRNSDVLTNTTLNIPRD
jgi:hypothetical protein